MLVPPNNIIENLAKAIAMTPILIGLAYQGIFWKDTKISSHQFVAKNQLYRSRVQELMCLTCRGILEKVKKKSKKIFFASKNLNGFSVCLDLLMTR